MYNKEEHRTISTYGAIYNRTQFFNRIREAMRSMDEDTGKRNKNNIYSDSRQSS